MLSRSEALDLPDIPVGNDQQARIAALGITISQFQKTLQGRALIERQELFILSGMIYQGYNQKAVECPEDHLTEAEIDAAHDIDGSKQRVLDTRRRRFDGNRHAKDTEHGERRKLKISQERDELELMLLKRRLAKEDAVDPGTDPGIDPETEPEIHVCPADGCGKTFASANKLRGHMVGAKH